MHLCCYEALEPRLLLAAETTVWTGDAHTTDFNTPGNWSNGVPNNINGNAYTAQFANVPNVTLDLSAPVTSSRIEVDGGTVTVNLKGQTARIRGHSSYQR